jgi:hypothetical protein
MKRDPQVNEALAGGKSQARRVLATRAKARKRRAARLAAVVRAKAAAGEPVAALAQAGLATASPLGVLVAEGDSWFDYFGHDVLDVLYDEYGYDVESVAHYGHRIEDMAYADQQLEKLVRALERVVQQNRRVKAILLSGGGNDIAGRDEFAMLLNHSASPAPGLNEAVVTGVIDERLRHSYVHILSAVTRASVELTGAPIPILVHGYDYAVPDGRGVLGGYWLLPGPWLRPGLACKGYASLAEGKRHVRALIDRFNEMLARVASLPEFRHVRHVDLRRALPAQDHERWWANELHPKPRGFERIVERVAAVLDEL